MISDIAIITITLTITISFAASIRATRLNFVSSPSFHCCCCDYYPYLPCCYFWSLPSCYYSSYSLLHIFILSSFPFHHMFIVLFLRVLLLKKYNNNDKNNSSSPSSSPSSSSSMITLTIVAVCLQLLLQPIFWLLSRLSLFLFEPVVWKFAAPCQALVVAGSSGALLTYSLGDSWAFSSFLRLEMGNPRLGRKPLTVRYYDDDSALVQFPYWLVVTVSGWGPDLLAIRLSRDSKVYFSLFCYSSWGRSCCCQEPVVSCCKGHHPQLPTSWSHMPQL